MGILYAADRVDYGAALVTVDGDTDKAVVEKGSIGLDSALDLYLEPTWKLVASNLDDVEHTVTIEILDPTPYYPPPGITATLFKVYCVFGGSPELGARPVIPTTAAKKTMQFVDGPIVYPSIPE